MVLKKHIVFDCDGTLVDTSGTKYKLYSGVKECLMALSADCIFYIWTARGRTSTLRILDELGIRAFFESISTPDDHFTKPHVEGLIHLVGHVPKSSICVIGDSSSDILGAKNFGVLAIGANWNPEASADHLRDAGADFIVSHPEECSRIIGLNVKGASHV